MTYIYEKLDVWKIALQFASDVMETVSTLPNTEPNRWILQKTEVSAAGISSAIAAGKSYRSKHDFVSHLYQARGALYETMTLLALLKQNNIIRERKFIDFNTSGNQLAAMLTALIKSIYAPKASDEKAA